MNPRGLDLVFLGLSLSSSWGNGHATTYRSLLKGLHRRGHRIVFLEREQPWYAENRDLAAPDFCELRCYDDVAALRAEHAQTLRRADTIIIGSYVPDGVAVIDTAAALCTDRLCFYDIDTPVTIARLVADDRQYLVRRHVPLFDVYFSFTGGPMLKRLEDQHGARRAEPLYCSVDIEAYRNTGEPKGWDLGYLGTYSPDRQPALERLLIDVARRMPERQFVVAGSLYPRGIDWPPNVERIEHLPPAEHPSFYSRQRFTLNITRADMIAAGWSPSVRLFEAAACETPIISDSWPGLSDFFPAKKAIRTAASTAEVIEILSLDDKARVGVAAEAHARVVSHHSGEARAAELERVLEYPEARSGRDTIRGLIDQAI